MAYRHFGGLIMLNTHDPRQNQLLNALSASDYERLLPDLEYVSVSRGDVLHEPGIQMRHVYFPTNAIVCLMYEMEDGASAEVAVVGNEGVVGVPLFTGGETMSNRAVVQSAGDVFRLKGQMLKEEF